MSVTEIESLLARTNALEEFDFATADTVLRNAMALSRNLFGTESSHVAELGYVVFRPSHITYNTGHYMNRVHWNEGTERLRRVLNAMAYELKISKAKGELQSPEKVTLKWLFHHVSVGGWLIAGGLLSAAFGFGVFAAKNDLLAKIIALFNSTPKP
ncbi:hypothetical protein [Aromatoleum evansii]|uniref:hypothetical protein n=1 Tax=Aromatoleum evansii TaxID=59406 RepID=UPI00145FBE14|nr:hypothetical protein [Aromatoleum evansii]NMG30067.1 hypothetical protein [Aromatoleum evansii]